MKFEMQGFITPEIEQVRQKLGELQTDYSIGFVNKGSELPMTVLII